MPAKSDLGDTHGMPGHTEHGTGSPRSAWVVLTIFFVALLVPLTLPAIPSYAHAVATLPEVVRWLIQPAIWCVAMWLGLRPVAHGGLAGAARELGMTRPTGVAAIIAVGSSIPMIAVGAAAGLRTDLKPLTILFSAGVWVVAEEMLFRGFAFGQLVRRAGWNVWLAAGVTGLIFGLAHMVNAAIRGLDPAGQALSITIIAAGGVAYAWLYYRWKLDLWFPITLHAAMNLWWELFAMADHPAGNGLVIASRVATVVIAIIATEIWLYIERGRTRDSQRIARRS